MYRLGGKFDSKFAKSGVEHPSVALPPLLVSSFLSESTCGTPLLLVNMKESIVG